MKRSPRTVHPGGRHPKLLRTADIRLQGVSDVQHRRRGDPQLSDRDLEDRRGGLVRAARLGRHDRVETKSILRKDVPEHRVVRVRNDGPRHTLQRFEDGGHLWIRLRPEPLSLEHLHVGLGIGVDPQLLEGPREELGVDADPEPYVEMLQREWLRAKAYPEVPAVLEALEGVPRAVVSNADDAMLRDILSRNRLRFDSVVTSE